MRKLFSQHIETVKKTMDSLLAKHQFDGVVVNSGTPMTYFADDQTAAFRATAYFSYFCPENSRDHTIVYEPGKKPKLIFVEPKDFWHEPAQLGLHYWIDEFEVTVVNDIKERDGQLPTTGRYAHCGPIEDAFQSKQFVNHPEKFLTGWDWHRGLKTDYEVHCLRKANERAALGHKAVYAGFIQGKSELAMHHDYLMAVASTESELPYNNIIALNEKAAVLHYAAKRNVGDGKVLLIDAGAPFERYGSDITRTYVLDTVPQLFSDLLTGMEILQKEICSMLVAGKSYGELHHLAHLKIGQLLIDHDILKGVDASEAVEQSLVRAFFPHGLGHMLGLLVHDVGGHLANEDGEKEAPPSQHPKLRCNRIMQPGMVLTVEPGLYFIAMLLDELRADSEKTKKVDWAQIDLLMPLGGIRIEDDVLVTSSAPDNLTRPFLP